MTLLSRAAGSLLERRAADPRAPWGDSTPPSNGSLGLSASGGSVVTEKTALQLAAVYGSVRVISDSLSALPFDLMNSPHRRTGDMLPPSPLLTKPYAEISRIDWWVQYVMSMALRGNFFGWIIERDRNLYATQIKPIHPDNVRIRRLYDGTIEYRFHGEVVPLDNVFHVKYLSVPEALAGLNPIEYMRIFGNARSAEMYGDAYFQNSANPSGVIEVPDELDPEETKAMAQEWTGAHGGIGRAHLPAVLTEGATFKPISITPQDSQFLETRQFDATMIAGTIFGVPPHMIGLVDRTTSWGTGIEQQEMGFVKTTLIGYLSRGEEALTALHPPGEFVKADLRERLRGDTLQRYQAHTLGVAGGFLTPDEARADEDKPPLPGGIGESALAPINSTTLKALVDQQLAAKAEETPPPGTGDNDPGTPGGKQ